jgi:hypothetical protein
MRFAVSLDLAYWHNAAQLDNAARNHLRYIIRNLPADTNAYGHAELPGKPDLPESGQQSVRNLPVTPALQAKISVEPMRHFIYHLLLTS